MKENWLEAQGITAYQDLHEGALYWMDVTDIELLFQRSLCQKDEEAKKELKDFQREMDKLDEKLWQ
eukprot:5692705-Amphidinium_carterae.2